MRRALPFLLLLAAGCGTAPAHKLDPAVVPLPYNRPLRFGSTRTTLLEAYPGGAVRRPEGPATLRLPMLRDGGLSLQDELILQDDRLEAVAASFVADGAAADSAAAFEAEQARLLQRCLALYGSPHVEKAVEEDGKRLRRRVWKSAALEAMLDLHAYAPIAPHVAPAADLLVQRRAPRPARAPEPGENAAAAVMDFFRGDFPGGAPPPPPSPPPAVVNVRPARTGAKPAPAKAAATPAPGKTISEICAESGGVWTNTKEKWRDPESTRQASQCLSPYSLELFNACPKGSWDPSSGGCR